MNVTVSDISFFVEGVVSFVGAIILFIIVGKLGRRTFRFLKENTSFEKIRDVDLKK